MKVTMDMPAVKSCSVEECVFNHKKICSTRAITVGDGETPQCDTYFVDHRHAKQSHLAGVGACKVTSCRFNKDYGCLADNIIVGHVRSMANCQTFVPI